MLRLSLIAALLLPFARCASSHELISFTFEECSSGTEKRAAAQGDTIVVLGETPYFGESSSLLWAALHPLSLLWSEVDVTLLAANGTRVIAGAVRSRTGFALLGEISVESGCFADAASAKGKEGWAAWVSPAAWWDASVAAMFDPLGLMRSAVATFTAYTEAAAASFDPRGKSAPHAKLNPFTGGCARAPKAVSVATVLCTVNRISTRFPVTLFAGVLLGSFADSLVASPAFAYGFLGLSGIAALGLVFSVWLAFMPMRDRAKWFAFIGTVNLGLFASGSDASSGIASALIALLPESQAARYGALLAVAVIVVLIFSLTLYCCAIRGVAESAPTRIFMGIAVRAIAVALLLFASQIAPLNVAVAFFFVGAQPLLVVAWWLVGALTLPFSVIEVFVNATLVLACGTRCRLVTALREMLLLETPEEVKRGEAAEEDIAAYASPIMPHATTGAVRQRAVSTRR